MRYVVAASLVALTLGLTPAAAGPAARQPVLVFASADVFEPGARVTTENVADLYLLKGNTVIRRLTRTTLWEEYPSWSPDGRRIAFSRGSPVCHALTCERRPGFDGMSIWVGRPGASARRITRTGDSYIDHSPMWSPNGRTIAFARVYCCEEDPSKDGIYTIAPDGKRQERIFRGRAKALDWSPDGSTIVFLTEFGGVRLLDVTTGDVTRPEITNLGGGKTDVAWSPDGERLAVTAAAGIYVVEAEGGRARRVVRIRAGYEFGLGVSWSPDGRRIAFSGTLERNPEARPDIFVVGVNGRGLKRLTTNPGADFDPQWRP